MSKLSIILKIKDVFKHGGNVINYLRDQIDNRNDPESIMISYDFQAGSYTKLAEVNKCYLQNYTKALSDVIQDLGSIKSIMEVGVGEATVMIPLIDHLDPHNRLIKFGFDISWSRVRYAKDNVRKSKKDVNLFVANLFSIPLPDNSVDVVYTSHSLEPNGGKEKEALLELLRVARSYVVLLEPDFERASEEARQRMIKHGYVRNLSNTAKEFGYELLIDRPFEISINELNPTALLVIKKADSAIGNNNVISYQCPVSHTLLKKSNNIFFSKESGLMFPIIDGIPCLVEQAAILGTHFDKFNNTIDEVL
jgi:ubiquinone/menaquinone biosynthesis C-methylase UbiE